MKKQTLKKHIAISAIGVLSLLLNGCGFHFRNSENLPPSLHTIRLQNNNTRSELTAQLAANLQQLQAHILTTSQPHSVTLVILQDNFTQNSVALGTAQQLNNTTLSYTVTIVLRNSKGENITTPMTFVSRTFYLQNANQVLGDLTGLPQIQHTLISDTVQKILIYLDSQHVRQQLATASV